MEIKSDPFIEVEYLDYDFLFTSGNARSFSLKPADGDTAEETDVLFRLQTVSPKETIVVYKSGLAGYSTRKRVMRFPVEGVEALIKSASANPRATSDPARRQSDS